MDKMMYLAELRQLASVARDFEDYTRVMKRVERVCDSIERDLELAEDATTTVMVNAVTCDAGELAEAVVRGIERLHLFQTGCKK